MDASSAAGSPGNMRVSPTRVHAAPSAPTALHSQHNNDDVLGALKEWDPRSPSLARRTPIVGARKTVNRLPKTSS